MSSLDVSDASSHACDRPSAPSGPSTRSRLQATTSPRPSTEHYRMPAEWEPHRATWIAWPHNRLDWPGKVAAVQWAFVEIVRWLSRDETVCILVKDVAQERRARRKLGDTGVDLDRVEFHTVPTDRAWLRDSGPTFVHRAGEAGGQPIALDWKFTGWARLSTCRRDDKVPGAIAAIRDTAAVQPVFATTDAKGESRRVVFEGGALDVDGRGLGLTTESCLLGSRQARNPGVSRDDLETVLARYLGVRHVIWLAGSLVGDDTHGHVDVVARFARPGCVVYARSEDRNDANHDGLVENEKRLRAARDLQGEPLELVALPVPAPLSYQGVRLPATYLNFYIGNRVVLVPTYNDPLDRVALDRLERVFPDRRVVGLHCADLIVGGGALHCLTQPEPFATDGVARVDAT